jgi:hypothetical protein
LVKNVEWYKQFEFKIEEQVQDSMMFEMNAGKVISKVNWRGVSLYKNTTLSYVAQSLAKLSPQITTQQTIKM